MKLLAQGDPAATEVIRRLMQILSGQKI